LSLVRPQIKVPGSLCCRALWGEAMPQDGVIRVEDLLRSPALQLRLIAGW